MMIRIAIFCLIFAGGLLWLLFILAALSNNNKAERRLKDK